MRPRSQKMTTTAARLLRPRCPNKASFNRGSVRSIDRRHAAMQFRTALRYSTSSLNLPRQSAQSASTRLSHHEGTSRGWTAIARVGGRSKRQQKPHQTAGKHIFTAHEQITQRHAVFYLADVVNTNDHTGNPRLRLLYLYICLSLRVAREKGQSPSSSPSSPAFDSDVDSLDKR